MLVPTHVGLISKSRFLEEQVVAVLHEREAGTKVVELVRRHGVTEKALYR